MQARTLCDMFGGHSIGPCPSSSGVNWPSGSCVKMKRTLEYPEARQRLFEAAPVGYADSLSYANVGERSE